MDRRYRILIVEDSPTMRQLLVFALKRLRNADITEAHDGMDGLRKVTSDDYDLALVDINMPVMDGLKLISLRTNYMVNSWMRNLQALKRDHALDNPLHVHPQDMSRLNLEPGSEVTVSSEHGRVIARVTEDDTLKPGVVAMTHGWGHGNNQRLSLASNHPGINVNALLPTGAGSFDPLSNMSFMTGIPVSVSAA